MSKKKKRLDKKLIAERLRELESEARENKSSMQVQRETPETPKKVQAIGKKPQKQPTTEPQKKELSESDRFIIRDLKKVVILTAIIIVIFVALYFVNLKTNYLLVTSDKIFKVLHIGQS